MALGALSDMVWDGGSSVFLCSHSRGFPLGVGVSCCCCRHGAYLGFFALALCTVSFPSPSPFPPFFPLFPFGTSPSSLLSMLGFGFFTLAVPVSAVEIAHLRAVGGERLRPLRVVLAVDRVCCIGGGGWLDVGVVVVGCGLWCVVAVVVDRMERGSRIRILWGDAAWPELPWVLDPIWITITCGTLAQLLCVSSLTPC